MSLKVGPRLVHYYPRALVGDGGCSYAVRGWAAAVAGAGAKVVVACDQDGERPIGEVDWRPLAHRGRRLMRAPAGLGQFLDQTDYLILHSGWVYHNVQAAKIAGQAGVPYLLTPHGAYDPNVVRRKRLLKHIWWRLMEQGVVARASAIHIFFEEERDFLRRLGYAGPFVVAPSGVTIPEPVERQLGTGNYVLWMGRFDIEHKGIDLLLHALRSLPPEVRPPTRLHGPDWQGGKERVKQLVRELELESSVSIGKPVYRSEKWDTIRNCRLFVFPSRWEAQGIAALEAAGVGVPVITTNTTFVGRQLAREGAAIVVDANAQSIASAIMKGWSCDCSTMSSRGARLVKEKFAWTEVAASFLRQCEALQ